MSPIPFDRVNRTINSSVAEQKEKIDKLGQLASNPNKSFAQEERNKADNIMIANYNHIQKGYETLKHIRSRSQTLGCSGSGGATVPYNQCTCDYMQRKETRVIEQLQRANDNPERYFAPQYARIQNHMKMSSYWSGMKGH